MTMYKIISIVLLLVVVVAECQADTENDLRELTAVLKRIENTVGSRDASNIYHYKRKFNDGSKSEGNMVESDKGGADDADEDDELKPYVLTPSGELIKGKQVYRRQNNAAVGENGGKVDEIGVDVGKVEKEEGVGKVGEGVWIKGTGNEDEKPHEIKLGKGEEREPEVTEEEMEEDDVDDEEDDGVDKKDLDKDEQKLVLERLLRNLLTRKDYE